MSFSERLWKYLLVFSLELVLVIPNCAQRIHDRGVRSHHQYWKQTGLTDAELQNLLGDHACYLNETQYLACASAVATAAEKQNLYFTPQGQLVPLKSEYIAHRFSERRYLALWKGSFDSRPKKPFLQRWEEIKENTPKPFLAVRTAEALNAYLSVLKDPHSYLIPLALYEEMIASHETKESGTGMVAKATPLGMVVRKVLKGSPADLARIKKGDVILKLNGRKVQSITRLEMNDLLKFRSGERLGILLKTKEGNRHVDLFKREGIYESVEAKMLRPSIGLGLVVIHKFARNTCEHLRKHLIELKENNLRGLILDLRDNPGGLVSEAACVLSQFVPEGTLLFETRHLDTVQKPDFYFADHTPVYRGPMAVVINSGSASAAEIVAGALKDLKRGLVVGETSFGKGSFQDGHIWGANDKIALFQTEGFYYFPSGWTAQLTGVTPDVSVDFNFAPESREQDLYYNPIRPLQPKDQQKGLVALQGKVRELQRLACGGALESRLGSLSWSNEALVESEADPQIQTALQAMSCGDDHDRHGRL